LVARRSNSGEEPSTEEMLCLQDKEQFGVDRDRALREILHRSGRREEKLPCLVDEELFAVQANEAKARQGENGRFTGVLFGREEGAAH
jgi:hypothetical protein